MAFLSSPCLLIKAGRLIPVDTTRVHLVTHLTNRPMTVLSHNVTECIELLSASGLFVPQLA